MSSTQTFVRRAALAAPGLLILGLGPWFVRADEPGRLARLFRFGGAPTPAPASAGAARPAPPADAPRDAPPLTPAEPGPTGARPRLVPQPRQYRGVTDADPIVTRVAVGRTDDGTPFGMFLQVFADGTVIDSEGVHQVGREGVKPLVDALSSGDLYRVKGHCGGPSTDFTEHVHVVVYERSLGRLKANAFSFSGNPQGCDNSVRQLQTALDALQSRFSRTAPAAPGGPAAPTFSAPAPPPPLVPAAAPIRLNDGSGPGRP